jgi:DNA-binding winged helix-turn-helix (wHTH) protein
MPSPIRFGQCELDLDARQLTRGGQFVHLSPKAFQLLKVLVEARPKALSKAQLHEHIWPDTFVTDDSLARLVTEVRVAIGDHARSPAFLRTVHAFGYAFANINQDTGDAVPAAAGSTCCLVFDGRAVILANGDNIIGRDPTARLVLDSIRVSRRHAKIAVTGRRAVLEDLGSRNGTSVGNQKVDGPIELADGDAITIGGFEITFRTGADELPTQPAGD